MTSSPTKKFIFSIIFQYAWVFFGFAIRNSIPAAYHLIYPVLFIISVFISATYLHRTLKENMREKDLRGFTICLVLLVNLFLLYQISSSNREYEIRNCFAKNESSLTSIVNHYKPQKDNFFISCPEEVNAEYFAKLYGYDVVRLYTCTGYGYELIHSDSANITRPKVAPPGAKHGSPVTKWIKLKDHWYYCAFFD